MNLVALRERVEASAGERPGEGLRATEPLTRLAPSALATLSRKGRGCPSLLLRFTVASETATRVSVITEF